MSIKEADREAFVDIAKKMQDAGLKLIGTKGTANYLAEKGINMEAVMKLHEGIQQEDNHEMMDSISDVLQWTSRCHTSPPYRQQKQPLMLSHP
jgi:hypothetical protein